MTKTELICDLAVMAVSLIVATMIFSDIVSERSKEYQKLRTVIALVLSVYSALGLATFAEYYYSPDFKVWRVAFVAYSIFGAYFVVSIIIGFHKIKRDKEKRLCINKHMKKSPKASDSMAMKDSLERDNCHMVTQDNLIKRDDCNMVIRDNLVERDNSRIITKDNLVKCHKVDRK